MTGIKAIAGLFAGPGARDYLGEAVTIGAHMRQAGALAETAGAPAPLVAAALLHDIGHLRNETDSKHGDAGARWRCAAGTTRPRTQRSRRPRSRTSGRYLAA